MKALILSIKAGYGHHSAGHAVVECFESHGCECLMLDTFEYISKFLCDGVQDGYLLTTKYLKEAYGRVYSTLDKRDEPVDRYSPTVVVSKVISKKLVKFIDDYNPDIIIGTHSFVGVLLTVMKQRGYIKCPTIGIITDFTVHPFWESTQLDAYVLPDRMLIPSANRKGIPTESVLPIGIPIRKQFSQKNDKEFIRQKLGLQQKKTVLVMMGSMGFGSITDVIHTLDEFQDNFQIVCVCGNNEKAKSSIDEVLWNKNVINLGFITNISEYMDAADVIVTKPGGLTTSEAMAKGLPMILMNPIPGQEDRNIQFLVNAGAGIMVTDTYPLEYALYAFFKCDWKSGLMKQAVSEIGKPNATEDLYDASLKLIENKDVLVK